MASSSTLARSILNTIFIASVVFLPGLCRVDGIIVAVDGVDSREASAHAVSSLVEGSDAVIQARYSLFQAKQMLLNSERYGK